MRAWPQLDHCLPWHHIRELCWRYITMTFTVFLCDPSQQAPKRGRRVTMILCAPDVWHPGTDVVLENSQDEQPCQKPSTKTLGWRPLGLTLDDSGTRSAKRWKRDGSKVRVFREIGKACDRKKEEWSNSSKLAWSNQARNTVFGCQTNQSFTQFCSCWWWFKSFHTLLIWKKKWETRLPQNPDNWSLKQSLLHRKPLIMLKLAH